MSLTSALNASVGALRAQGAAIGAVSENIANASTTAYKIKTINFQALVTGEGNTASGGVLFTAAQNVDVTGQISSTGNTTNLAIKGGGFFVVTDNLQNKPSSYAYSRNGNFSTDSSGNLVNDEGYYLLGQVTDVTGVVTATNKTDLNSLEPISLNAIKGAASPTSLVIEQLNLPADATISSSFTSSIEVFDSLGISSTVDQTWTKTGINAWTLTLADPHLTTDTSITTGTIAPASIAFVFNGDGSLLSTTPAPDLTVTGWTTGANDSNVSLDVGTIGRTDGISQFSSNTTNPDLEISAITGNGARFGNLSSIEIDSEGLVTAVFDNGLRQPVYQVPVATFQNPNGLTHINGSVYDENQNAGNVTLQLPNVGNAGGIVSSALEESTSDTSEEFNKMIVAQQGYSAAAQIISTVKTMYDTLTQAVR